MKSGALGSLRSACVSHICSDLKNYDLSGVPDDLCDELLKHLHANNQLTDAHLVRFLTPTRTHLVVPYSSHIRRSALHGIANCTALEVLDLSHCKQLNNATLRVVLSRCSSLRSLSLCGLTRISERGFETGGLSASSAHRRRPPARQLSTHHHRHHHHHGGGQGVGEDGDGAVALAHVPLRSGSRGVRSNSDALGSDVGDDASGDDIPFAPRNRGKSRNESGGCGGGSGSGKHRSSLAKERATHALSPRPSHLLSLRKLVLAQCSQIDDTALYHIVKLCPQLASLNIAHCRRVTDKGVRDLVRSCAELVSLDVSFCSRLTSNAFLFGEADPRPARGRARGGQPDDAHAHHAHHPDHDHHHAHDRAFAVGQARGRGQAGAAEEQAVHVARGGNGGEEHAGAGDGGVRGSWSDVAPPPQPQPLAPPHGSLLRKLRLNGLPRISDTAVHRILSHCPSLHLLSLRFCVSLTPACLAPLPGSSSLLSCLDLHNCSGVDDAALARLRLPSLRSLTISFLPGVTDASVVAIAPQLASLTCFVACQCAGITDASVTALLVNCTCLRRLDVGGSCGVVGRFAASLPCCASLHTLSVEHCASLALCGHGMGADGGREEGNVNANTNHHAHAHVHDHPLRSLPPRLPALKHFSCGGTLVGDACMAWVVHNAPRLRTLNCSSLQHLSPRTLGHVIAQARALKRLDVSFCPLIDSKGVQSVFSGQFTGGENLLVVNVTGNGLSVDALELILSRLPCLSRLHAHHSAAHEFAHEDGAEHAAAAVDGNFPPRSGEGSGEPPAVGGGVEGGREGGAQQEGGGEAAERQGQEREEGAGGNGGEELRPGEGEAGEGAEEGADGQGALASPLAASAPPPHRSRVALQPTPAIAVWAPGADAAPRLGNDGDGDGDQEGEEEDGMGQSLHVHAPHGDAAGSGSESSSSIQQYARHPLFHHPAMCLSATRCLHRHTRARHKGVAVHSDTDTDSQMR